MTGNLTPIDSQIIAEIYKAFHRLGADRELLATVGSWGDTLADEEVLAALRKWNVEEMAYRS